MALENAQVLTIGIDLGGTNLRVAAYTPEHGVLNSITLRTRLEAGPPAVVDDMCDAIRELLHQYEEGRELAGIGVGSPGPLELPAGRLHHPPNLPGWDGFPLLEEMEKRLQRPVLLESDANVAALAEYALGLGKQLGVESLCMLTLGTGVGNGIILNGKLWHGATGMGGEAGHMTIHPDGPLCGCGNNGCLEACASATALVNAAERLIAAGKAPGLALMNSERGPLTARDLAEAAQLGDADAREIYAETGRALGICLAGLINILNLPLYVVGGGVANSWDLLSPAMFRELERRSYVYALTAPGRPASKGMPCGGTQVLPAKLGAEAGLLGACILPLYSLQASSVSA
ncbi:MAG: ROK family protein [Acidobacteriota bacterium]|nr:ROK family protein [Acidobacteriota bacterium]